MSKYLGPRLRIIRRFGNLPGLTSKIATKKFPGHYSAAQKKIQKSSDYKIRLFEKQKLRYNYGLTESQLKKYVREAKRKRGSTAFFLMQLLEMRLDTIIFRLGLAPTIPAARQFVNHGHVYINEKNINIPSFQCKINDMITLQNKKGTKQLVENNLANPRFSTLPDHLFLDLKLLKAKIINLVSKKDLSFAVNELLIIEYYARLA